MTWKGLKARVAIRILGTSERALVAMTDTAYSGASRIRKQLHNWQPTQQPADAELLPELGLLTARARDLDRNNGVAAGAVQTLQDNTVGLGLRLAAAPDFRALGRSIDWAEAWSRNVESLWRTWADTTACDVAGRINFASMTQMTLRSVFESGAALALPLWMERGDTPFRTCLQMVDVDRLSNPQNLPSSISMRNGIEIDEYGRPLAYHIRKLLNVPFGLIAASAWWLPGNWEWERIPATTEWGRARVLHCCLTDRPEQSTGKPILAPVIEQFRMLDAYQRTELQSSIVNSLVAGIIETPMDPAGIAEMVGGDPNKYLSQKAGYRVQLEGGTLIPLYPGDKLTPYIPARPAPQFAQFFEAVIRQIACAIGLPYELVLKDFSKTNYSSARAALLEAWRFFTNRRQWIATYWCARVYELWLEEAVSLGLVDAPDFYAQRALYTRAKWIGPGRGWIDPVKEAQASQLRMDNLISTLEAECAEQGLDWNDVIDQRALEVARLKAAGLYREPGAVPVSNAPADEPVPAPGGAYAA